MNEAPASRRAPPVEETPPAPPPPKRRGRLLGLAKIALALVLLGFVAASLPWRDVLVVSDGTRSTELSGEIEGNWRGDRIRFLPDRDEAPGPLWTPELREAWEEGAALAVERRAPPSEDRREPAGYDWRPSMPRVFLGMDPGWLAGAFVALAVGALFGVTRWWRILQLARCPSTWANTARLGFLGLFFNLVVPGLTGGDVVKAVLVVREHPERRADALVSVVIDRMIGLWALIGLATVVIWSDPSHFAALRWPVVASFAAASACVAIALMRRVRRALRIDALIERLPQKRRLKELDRAAALFSDARLELALAIVLSLANHLCVIAAIWCIGRGFGDELGFAQYISISSVANVLSSLPLTPGGWGVGEQAFGTLFQLAGAAFTVGVAVSVTYRLCNMGLGLLGGAFLLLPGAERVRGEVRTSVQS